MSFTEAPKDVQITPGDITICEGQTLSLTCNSEGTGPFQHEWGKTDGCLSSLAEYDDAKLTIQAVHISDAGRYYCKVRNIAGTKAAEVVVIRTRRPRSKE